MEKCFEELTETFISIGARLISINFPAKFSLFFLRSLLSVCFVARAHAYPADLFVN